MRRLGRGGADRFGAGGRADRLGRAPDERTLRLLGTADGNPFLATQIIDGLAADPGAVPAELTAAITSRLLLLNDASHALVQLIAVAGRPVPTRDVPILVAGTDGVADAIESGLIVRSGDSLAFRHDLVMGTSTPACQPMSRAMSIARWPTTTSR